MLDPLASLGAYEAFIYALPDRYTYYPALNPGLYHMGSLFGRVEGAHLFRR